jgi:hypothetical protein
LNAINDPTDVACDNHALMRSGANINGIVLLKHKRDSLGVNPFVCIDLNEHLRRPFALRKTDSGYGSRPAAIEYSKTDSAGGLRVINPVLIQEVSQLSRGLADGRAFVLV